MSTKVIRLDSLPSDTRFLARLLKPQHGKPYLKVGAIYKCEASASGHIDLAYLHTKGGYACLIEQVDITIIRILPNG